MQIFDYEKAAAYSEQRHSLRRKLRTAMIDFLKKDLTDAERRVVFDQLVESAVGLRAWLEGEPHALARHLNRLARRVRDGEPIEI